VRTPADFGFGCVEVHSLVVGNMHAGQGTTCVDPSEGQASAAKKIGEEAEDDYKNAVTTSAIHDGLGVPVDRWLSPDSCPGG
jgi:hypothetical protein